LDKSCRQLNPGTTISKEFAFKMVSETSNEDKDDVAVIETVKNDL